jgi:6,7-dimethyl-8-ribityllumazine synthase
MQRTAAPSASATAGQSAQGARLLVLEARFYTGIADALAEGAVAAAEAAGCTVERITVPGALELPQALLLAVRAGQLTSPAGAGQYHAAVVLGCVIRGETTHYDTVCNEANRGVMEVALEHGIAVGNGILTVENEAQALARCAGGAANKGGDAARAALRLVEIARQFERERSARV